MTAASQKPMTATCLVCGRARTPVDVDYTPWQIIRNEPLGWYSGDDGEMCPADFTFLMQQANGRMP